MRQPGRRVDAHEARQVAEQRHGLLSFVRERAPLVPKGALGQEPARSSECVVRRVERALPTVGDRVQLEAAPRLTRP
jgi:hypothetical protein